MPLPKTLPAAALLFISAGLVVALVAGWWLLRNPSPVEPWNVYMPGVGTGSSPRVADLTGDGILDIVMGAGGRENQPSDTAIIALDGRSGELLWHLAGRNQMVGSAVFKDITDDGIADVFIGGRSAQLAAINGKTGKLIWEFFPMENSLEKRASPADSGWYNFFNPQFIADQDGDGLQELLISNGGDYLVPPRDPNRPTGNLLIVSSKNGNLLVKAPVPDGKETYMSPVVADFEGDGTWWVIFGTGGETIGGNLYRARLTEVLSGDLSGARLLASSPEKGFIAPPVLADITSDGAPDIIVCSVDGRMLAINGVSDSLLWQADSPNTEGYSSPAVGYFNHDSIPDFFANFGLGAWPTIINSVQLLVDGKTGQILYRNDLGGFQYASPVSADMNGDGFDDALLSLNTWYTDRSYENVNYSQLMVFDFHHQKNYPIGDTLPGQNLASTPWAGDLDGDGKLEVISCSTGVLQRTNDIDNAKGLRISLLRTGQPIKKTVLWGAYMGSSYNGVFSKVSSSSAKLRGREPKGKL
jgi:outer membrane protein assembly factor BamB